MKAFAKLVRALEETGSTLLQTSAIEGYFRTAPEADQIWATALLTGHRPRRVATLAELRDWAAILAGIPLWLFEECRAQTGDLAETIALILPEPAGKGPAPALAEVMLGLVSLAGMTPIQRRAAIEAAWLRLEGEERIVLNKVLTGGFRVGVSRGLTTRALAQATGNDEATLGHRLSDDWDPATTSLADLLKSLGGDARPYPFAGIFDLEGRPEDLGVPANWQAEWKWNGVRCQMINRPGAFALWSQDGEVVTDRFPEFALLPKLLLSGTVLDGEVLAWDTVMGRPLPIATLKARLSRKTLPKNILLTTPVRFMAHDLLELGGQDLRLAPLAERRLALERLLTALPNNLPVTASSVLPFADWEALGALRKDARQYLAEGLLLKRLDGPYLGNSDSSWRQWKPNPFRIVAVMLYAQAGAGRHDAPYADFTLAVRDGDALVPIGKVDAGLAAAECAEISRWAQANTLERFGPVRHVSPELVFELAFEGIEASPRHKSGIVLRLPRIERWLREKPLAEIDTIETLRAHLAEAGGPAPLTPRDI